MLSFGERALRLAGQTALLLGWRPEEFWAATPAELGAILSALETGQPALPDAQMLNAMMEQFPDG